MNLKFQSMIVISLLSVVILVGTVMSSGVLPWIGVGALILLLWLFKIIWTMSRGLQQAREILENYARGDLRARLPVEGMRHELDYLFKAINEVGVNTTEVMGEMKSATYSMNAALKSFESAYAEIRKESQEISDRSQTVAAAAEQSTAGIEQISQAVQGMSSNVMAVSAAMEELSATTVTIEERCKEENAVVTQSQQEADRANRSMLELQKLVNKISSITQVIEEIASQTNLLALNATIEAAGAGEAGKGFTVVANEVKMLSRQTANATGDIRSQVEQIQRMSDAVSQSISQLTEIIAKVGNSSTGTLNAVQEQRVAVSEISRNLAEASQSAAAISRGIQEVVVGARSTAENIARVHGAAENTVQKMEKTSQEVQKIGKAAERLAGITASFKAEAIRMELTPELLTTIVTVDSQHRRLFDLLYYLSSALVNGEAGDKILSVVDDLADYTKVHFRDEEALMTRAGYPDFDNHVKLHRAFEDKVAKAREDIANGQGMVASEIVKFLTDWLVQHIGRVDKKYVPYLKKAGIS